MLCRNLFFAVSSFVMWVMFLNLQAPRHPVLWRMDVQWYWEALSLDKSFWLQILCRDCHKVSCWYKLYSSLFIIVEFIRWTYISHIIGQHGGGVRWGRGPAVPVNSHCKLFFLSKQPKMFRWREHPYDILSAKPNVEKRTCFMYLANKSLHATFIRADWYTIQ